MKTYSFLWNEHEGKKGACEIATSLNKFLQTKAAEGAKAVYLFCDCCGGQNRNRFILIMLSNALKTLGFEKIELIFLVSGHSQNENDNSHSVIEQYSRARFVYSTNQWETVIQNAFKKNECISKVFMHDEFVNYKSVHAFSEFLLVYQDKCYPEVGSAEKKKKKLMWSEVKHLMFHKDDPDVIFFKYDYNEDFRKCLFKQRTPKTRIEKEVTQQLYTESVGVTAKKKADLLKLCQKGYIPKNHHAFYESMRVNSTLKDDDDTPEVKNAHENDESDDSSDNE